ncbi:MAG: hypothetical protein VXY94_09480 [Planctomycetota bacterium]|nr:hypothetical protein [Planctomycetota bacterium]MED5506774.1 hypothetical protein [Planctomycetota bacterium]
MKMYLIGAIALSSTTTMAIASIDFKADFHTAYGQPYMSSHMAADFENTGAVTDFSGVTRLFQSHSVTTNGSSMDITMRVDTVDGVTFRNSVLPGEQTQSTWDGNTFEVGGLNFHFGNYYAGQFGFGEVDGIDVGSEWEDLDGTTSVTYFFADGVSKSYVVDTAPGQINSYSADLTEFHKTFGVNFDGYFGGDSDYMHGDAIGIEITETISLVPAPGALALLGLGGLAARRRRG